MSSWISSRGSAALSCACATPYGIRAENPIFIETIERRGYRWIAPIHPPEAAAQESRSKKEEQEKDEVAAVPAVAEAASGDPAPSQWRLLVLIAALLLLAFAAWIFRPGRHDARASVAAGAVAAKNTHGSANREAEDLYLKGRFYWNKRTPESLHQAVDAFSQAIERDPSYADAYVGLADCYNLLREFSAMPANEAYLKAFAAAKKAVELAPESSDAHAALAFVSFWGMWDVQDADKEFRRAIELDPSSAKAHHWFATFLHAIRRWDEALAEIETARKLDPNASSILADKGDLLWEAGHREEALQLLKQLEKAEPSFASPHRYLRFAYFDTGDDRNYVAELKEEALLTHDDIQLAEAEAAGQGLAAGGDRGMVQALLAKQMALYKGGKLSPYLIAESEAKLGNSDEALKYLTMCVQSHDALVLNVDSDGSFDGLRHSAAFAQLIAIIGLPATR